MARTRHPKHQNVWVRQLANGQTRYDVPYREPDGKQRTKTFAKIADATAFLHSVEADKARGVYRNIDAGKIAFKAYAEQWLAAQTFERSSRDAVELRLRLHIFPALGSKRLRDIKPSTIQRWLRGLSGAESTKRIIFANVSTILAAAVDDELLVKNPCRAPSVSKPTPDKHDIVPWPVQRIFDVHDQMTERYRITVTLASGLGLRQGEVFGLSPDDIDWLRGIVRVRRQVKLFANNNLAFGLPKYRKTREVPLPPSVRDELAAYLAKYPATPVELPWGEPDSDKRERVTLILTTRERSALNRNYFNTHVWARALKAAGVAKAPHDDNGMHALRHFYASALLDAGVSIKVVAKRLGHADPAFTLRTYTHLMPESDDKTRDAIDGALSRASSSTDVVSVLYGELAEG